VPLWGDAIDQLHVLLAVQLSQKTEDESHTGNTSRHTQSIIVRASLGQCCALVKLCLSLNSFQAESATSIGVKAPLSLGYFGQMAWGLPIVLMNVYQYPGMT
jgi:hypothetical protein